MSASQITELRVPRLTGTYADVLRAVGLASLISEMQGSSCSVAIGDVGHDYLITLSAPMIFPKDDHGGSDRPKLSVGYRYLAHEKAEPAPLKIVPEPYPYVTERKNEELRNRADQPKTGSKRLKPRRPPTGEVLTQQLPQPEPRFQLMKAINSLRSGSEAWNKLALALHKYIEERPDELWSLIAQRLRTNRNEPSELDEAAAILQAFNPIAGKGVNRLRPDGAVLNNPGKPWCDWFDEWCKYRAASSVLNAAFTGKGGKDLKFIALLPGTQIEISALRNVADEFVTGRWVSVGRAYSNVKQDVFILLGLARWLIERSEFAPVPENRLFRFLRTAKPKEPSPRDVIGGVATAYFKKMGPGRTLANVNTLLLPDWFPVTAATYEQWIAVIDEHRRVLRQLDEEKGEQAALLLMYRDALSANTLDRYLEFFSDHGGHVLRALAQDQFTEQFSVLRMEALVTGLAETLNPQIAILVKDSAFLAMADAVHEATVKAQYWKGQNQQEYEVHYGLAHLWKRAADQGADFICVLSDFVRAYNEENAKRKEKAISSRSDVARSDLDRVLEYMTSGKVDTRTVCLLLLAYGFAMTDEEQRRMQVARDKVPPANRD